MAQNSKYLPLLERLRFLDYELFTRIRIELEGKIRKLFLDDVSFQGLKLVGSASTGTMTRDSKDLDYIALFSGGVDNQAFKNKLLNSELDIRKVNEATNYGYIKIVGYFNGFEYVFVPSRNPEGKIETYVDDAFYHPDFIKANCMEDHVDNVLLTKEFFKVAGVYKSVQGISCELMMLQFGEFEKLLEYLTKYDSLRVNFSPNKEVYSNNPIVVDYPFLGRRSLVKDLTKDDYKRIQDLAKSILIDKRNLGAL